MVTVRLNQGEIKKFSPITFGASDLYYLLEYFLYDKKIWYCAGLYGWNSDIYKIDDEYISTGYRPVWKAPKNKKLFLKLEEKAEKLFHSKDYKFDKRKTIAKRLEKSLLRLLKKERE
jgi:hypothetical protein